MQRKGEFQFTASNLIVKLVSLLEGIENDLFFLIQAAGKMQISAQISAAY